MLWLFVVSCLPESHDVRKTSVVLAVESEIDVRTLENTSDMLSRNHVINVLNVERTGAGKGDLHHHQNLE